jgi:hypothetical protein
MAVDHGLAAGLNIAPDCRALVAISRKRTRQLNVDFVGHGPILLQKSVVETSHAAVAISGSDRLPSLGERRL